MSFLLLENLVKEFVGRGGEGIVRAVDQATISIEEGEFVTLLGPSGCGKTTTLRLIAGCRPCSKRCRQKWHLRTLPMGDFCPSRTKPLSYSGEGAVS